MANEYVALLAEGVDRNQRRYVSHWSWQRSPSSRRAWIEIIHAVLSVGSASVALLAEGVDRNSIRKPSLVTCAGRPPRGGRG